MLRNNALTRRLLVALVVIGTIAALGVSASAGAAATPSSGQRADQADGAKQLRFRVTIRNLGRADLTSVVYAVHNRTARLFRLGKKASAGLSVLAEDGATSKLLSEARGKRGVGSSDVGPRISPRRNASFEFTTTRKHLRLSWATMQVCSNDSFAGQSAVRLPARKVGARKVLRVRALDAGTEQNTESTAHVPCLGAHNVGPSENRVVRRSPGIKNIADLDNASDGWGRFLARITIKRIS